MASNLQVLPSDTETIAELRELYRAAELRAARMRLLSQSARELAEADPATLKEILKKCGQRLAFFLGANSASFCSAHDTSGIAIEAPGPNGKIIARIDIEGLKSINEIGDPEDRETVRMNLDLMGTTIDRIRREQERGQLLDTLQEREKNLEFLVESLFSAQEEERRRVSHDLHDGVAQTATALVRMLESMETESGAGPGTGSSIRPAEIARSLVSELRNVIAGLRPTLLDDLGLVAALRSLFEGLEADGYSVLFNIQNDQLRLSSLKETALFRVAQEAVSNIRKHSGGPCDVVVDLIMANDKGERVLRISDLGRGPSEETRIAQPLGGRNIGIEVMKERMAAIGGRLEWHAGARTGVVVEAWLPDG